MKTVVCGLGKCGSRMVLDLHALIYGGKYSCELRDEKETPREESFLRTFLRMVKGHQKDTSLVKNIHREELPNMHMGDPDCQNEVVSLCLRQSDDDRDTQNRELLKEDLIPFDNWHEACGQYHIIGEQVMRNLLATNDSIKDKVINKYIDRNLTENVSSYFLLFSAGGGSGCGTSTVLSKEISKRAREEYVNLLVAGIAVLPGAKQSDNFKISAGRFLTKFLSSEHATSFDTVFTISNTIMEALEEDASEMETRANIFAAQLICSLINSSSKFHRSPINTDGPELRKNIHGLSYFCFAQGDKQSDGSSLSSLQLLARALSPVSTLSNERLDGDKSNLTFQGTSISLVDRNFSQDQWKEMIEKIKSIKDIIQKEKKSWNNFEEFESAVTSLFPDPKKNLPLAMRSCQNVVVLRGIPKEGKSSSLEQSILVDLLKVLFPKASIHYYYTYHTVEQETLTLIPSNYISGEIIEHIQKYLETVWKQDISRAQLRSKLYGSDKDIDEETITDLLGEREHFEYEFKEFLETCERLSGKLGLSESDWEEEYITSAHVSSMLQRIHDIIEFVKKEKIVSPDEEELPIFDI
ncbi:MAG: hypothetical protein IJU76_04105 [Desulfovibrionaceae bacterium]|nr:hypothetical protein [Desulfovibrionaceae bacterium]